MTNHNRQWPDGIGRVRPDFPPIPPVADRGAKDFTKIPEPPKESDNMFNRIKRLATEQLVPFIRQNIAVDVAVSTERREVLVVLYLFGQRLLEREIKF